MDLCDFTTLPIFVPPMPFRFLHVALIVLCTFATAAHAENEPLLLKLDFTLNAFPISNNSPAYITAHHMEGKKDNQFEAVGNAELHKGGQAIFADRLQYQQDTRKVVADGAVRIEQNGDVITGSHLEYNLNSGEGVLLQSEYYLKANEGRGSADTLLMQGKDNYALHDVTYTTCPAGNDDWLLTMGELDIDRATQIGVAHNAFVKFKGVPILYSPWMDFPLRGQRKTGFLGPVIGSTTTGGTEISTPFYWNLAPNYDATIVPRLMDKRGLMLNNEIRYLEPGYGGQLQLDVLPHDRLDDNNTRSHEAWQQAQNLGDGFSDSWNLNRVSDAAYYRDLSTTVAGTSQVNLMREGLLNYNGDWWNASARIQNFQTLQDPSAPVPIPYARTPQITLSEEHGLGDAETYFAGEYVNFSNPSAINGQRLMLNPAISYPLLSDTAYFVTPRVGLNYTAYRFGAYNATNISSATRILPTFSLDSGMTFQRDMKFAEQSYIQTLEPRAYYVYIPYRNQDNLPVFDTTQGDLSFAQLFSENRFLGDDRIGDANQITLALTSRWLGANSGMELFKVTMGERFSFISPRVTLAAPATPPVASTNDNSKSDILLGITGRMSNALSLDTLWQYNPTRSNTEALDVSAHYQPEAGKVFNLGYQFSRSTFRQVALSEQWPLYGRWHTVISWNYSLLEKRMLEGLAGVEYNQSCWTLRMVAQSFATATNQFSTGFFVQLDLNGLGGIGSDPLDALKQSIPGYTKTNQSVPGESTQGLQ